MSRDIDRIPWDINHADGYLLCFDVPFGPDRPGCHADHYCGIAPVLLESRLSKHSQGRGSKLTRHARRAGIGWTLTRIWEDIDRAEERRLKDNSGMHWCPRCRTERVMAARDPAYGVAITAAKEQYLATVDQARVARDQAASRSVGTRLWNRAVAAAHEQMQQARHGAAAAWIAAHPRPGLRPAALACVLDGTPVTTPPTRARRAVLGAEAAEAAKAWPDGFVTQGPQMPDPDSIADPTDPWGAAAPVTAATPRQFATVSAGPEDPWSWPETEAG